MEKKIKKMYDALKEFRKDAVKARCMADSPNESWRLSLIIDATDEMIALLKDEITN